MRHRLFCCAAVACQLVLAGCSKKPETLATGPYDEAAMEAAIVRARTETGDFLRVLAAKDADSFAVKAAITEDEETEHIWLTDVAFADGLLVGKIGNDPALVTNVKFGQEWKVRPAEISDWMFVRDERIHGGYTIDPLLPQMPEAEAEEMRRRLVR